MSETQCDHQWVNETLREPNFLVAFGAKRTCKKCGRVEFADYCEGRIGGPWREILDAKKKEVK